MSRPARSGSHSSCAAQPDDLVIPVPDRLAALLESTDDTVGVSFDRELQGVLEDAEAVVSDAAETADLFGLGHACGRPLPAGRLGPRNPAPITLRRPTSSRYAPSGPPRLSAGLAEEYLPDPLFSQPALAPAPAARDHARCPARLPVLARRRPGLLVGDVDESLRSRSNWPAGSTRTTR